MAKIRNFCSKLTVNKETQNIMNNLTLEVKDTTINQQILLHI
jgi:hypothetical protein